MTRRPLQSRQGTSLELAGLAAAGSRTSSHPSRERDGIQPVSRSFGVSRTRRRYPACLRMQGSWHPGAKQLRSGADMRRGVELHPEDMGVPPAPSGIERQPGSQGRGSVANSSPAPRPTPTPSHRNGQAHGRTGDRIPPPRSRLHSRLPAASGIRARSALKQGSWPSLDTRRGPTHAPAATPPDRPIPFPTRPASCANTSILQI